jgi:hypothetical protein
MSEHSPATGGRPLLVLVSIHIVLVEIFLIVSILRSFR